MIFGRRRTSQETSAPEQQTGTPSGATGTTSDAPGAPGPQATGPGARANGTRPAGLRLTEGLLPIFGPAQVGDSTAPVRPPSEAERGRDSELRTTLTRMVGADGRSYVVAVPDEGPAAAEQHAAEGTSAPGRDS